MIDDRTLEIDVLGMDVFDSTTTVEMSALGHKSGETQEIRD